MKVQTGDLILLNKSNFKEPIADPIFGIIIHCWTDSMLGNALRFDIMWLNVDWDDDKGFFEELIYVYRKNYLKWREENLNV